MTSKVEHSTTELRSLQRELNAETTRKHQYYRQWTMLSDYMAHRKYLESTRKITELIRRITKITKKR